jgi:phenylacetic acid degradation operon negative regulatory protein
MAIALQQKRTRKMPRSQAGVNDWIKAHLKADSLRFRSLIITMFGDSVAPYSDGIWASDLIELLEPFGANDRLVRTSLFRLTEQGWVIAKRDGRRSYYTLAPSGLRRFQQAYLRVYTPAPDWDGSWATVILPKSGNGAPERAELRRELEWEGYAFLATGIFIRPTRDTAPLQQVLKELDLSDRAVVMTSRESAVASGKPVADLVTQCWDLEAVKAEHLNFLSSFAPLQKLLAAGAQITPEQAFVIQTLLIDAFRRVTLHDPRLPNALLPTDWPGNAAYLLCRDLYRRTYLPAREHLAPRFELAGNGARKLPAELLRRFGGLDSAE